MTWLKDNAEVLSLGLSLLVAGGGIIAWLLKRKGNSQVTQRSGDNSINVVGKGDVNIRQGSNRDV